MIYRGRRIIGDTPVQTDIIKGAYRMNQTAERSSVRETARQAEPKSPLMKLPVESEEMEIDLVDLAYVLFDKIHYIILSFLIGALLLSAYSFFLIKPTYTSTSKLYVVSASKDSVVDISDLNLGTSLTSDYSQLMLSYPVLDQIIDELDLDMSSDRLAKMISLTNPSQTRILNITVTSTDAQLACDIANTMAEVAVRYLPVTMSTSAPNIAQVARVSTVKAGPSYTRFTMIGALLGAVIAIGIITLLYLLDDTIHTSEDMEKYFGIVPLATIPENDTLNSDTAAEKKKKRRKRGSKKRKGAVL